MTPRIQPLTNEQAPASSRAILEQTQKAIGMVPNLHRTLAQAPAALKSYAESGAALAGGKLSPKLRESIAVATAGLNGCDYCASAHTAIGKNLKIDEGELTRNLGAESSDPRTAAVLNLVRSLIDNRGRVADQELDAVRQAGLGEEELIEVVAHVGLNLFTNYFNNLARPQIDFPKVELTATR